VVAYGEQLQLLQRVPHKLGDLMKLSEQNAVLTAWYRNNVLHLFALPSLIACGFISNAVLRTEDIQRLVWRVYPYVSSELFMRWEESQISAEVERTLAALAQLGVLEAVEGGHAWRRPAPTSGRAIQLSLLSQATIQTIERYYLAIALLRQAGTGQIAARALAERCQVMAQRITMLYGFNSPEFSDRALFETFIELLLERAVIHTDAAGNLVFDEVLERVAVDAELVLSEQIRHSILQVTHV
jgi:glycerol-3-phosphate O-acyltransferase